MRRLATLAVSGVSLSHQTARTVSAKCLRVVQTAMLLLIVLMSATTASGQYTFTDWARDHGYSTVMPDRVDASYSSPPIESLNGIEEFDWTAIPTTVLILSGNELRNIESGNFDGLTDLETLMLSSNRLPSIESGDFDGLANLKTLSLYNNQLSSIESDDFSGLPNLTYLYLDSNELTSIESGDFSELTNLTTLYLTNNRISSIALRDVDGLTTLRTLNLYINRISSIDSGAFSGLPSLSNLFLTSNKLSSIDPDDFSGLPNLRQLSLSNNQLSSIESDDFDELPNLRVLSLHNNHISNIQSGAFSGLPNLMDLRLYGNLAMTDLNLTGADFSSLTSFDVEDNANITSVSLRSTVLNQTSLAALMDAGNSWFGPTPAGIGELNGITEMDLSGVDFVKITDLEPLYVMDDLTDLWLVNTLNLDAFDLDVLLDNLVTIEGTSTEGILYMTQADFDAFNTAGGGLLAAWHAEPGHHVELVPEPSTLLLAGISLLGLVACGRRKPQ